MTGKDLIIYILKNNLENMPINKVIGSMLCTDAEYAASHGMGVESVRVLYSLGKLPGEQINNNIYIYMEVNDEKI